VGALRNLGATTTPSAAFPALTASPTLSMLPHQQSKTLFS
jgi:hypothetical protein